MRVNRIVLCLSAALLVVLGVFLGELYSSYQRGLGGSQGEVASVQPKLFKRSPSVKEDFRELPRAQTYSFGSENEAFEFEPVDVLVSVLGLTASQEEAVSQMAIQHIEEDFSAMMNGKVSKALLTKKEQEQALLRLLAPEQKLAYEKYKERKASHYTESQALKQFSDLSFLDLSEQQKDDLYTKLHDKAKLEVLERNEVASSSSIFINRDRSRGFFDSSSSSRDGEEVNEVFQNMSGADVADHIEKLIEKDNVAKLESVSSVLNEQQLDQLEIKLDARMDEVSLLRNLPSDSEKE